MFGNSKKKKDKKKITEENLPKVKKTDANGEKQSIPKGYKAAVSKDGTLISVSRTTDISGKKKGVKAPKKSEDSRKAVSKPSAEKNVTGKPVKEPKTAKKPKAAPQVAASAKKSEAVKKAVPKRAETKKRLKPLKHDEEFEQGTSDSGKIIVIKGKQKEKKPRRRFKQLRRVGKQGGYTVWDARTGKTFATESEAIGYAAEVFVLTGEIVPVTPTDRKVSHTYKVESKDEKK